MSQPKSSDAIAAKLRSAELRTRNDALVRLSQEPQQALNGSLVEALIENLSSPSKAVARRAAGVIAAGAVHNPAIVGRLLALLDGPQESTRWAAAYALGQIDGALDLRACAPLLEALGNSDGDVRWAAHQLVVRLGRSHRGPIRDRLLALKQRADTNTRKMALYALRDLGIREAAVVAAACAACASADGQVRLAGLSLLKGIGAGYPEAVDTVVKCLQSDSDQGVRRSAAFTLGYLSDRSAPVLAALHEAAGSTHDAAMRKAAHLTLSRLKEEP